MAPRAVDSRHPALCWHDAERGRGQGGFTLIELLVVIIILGVLASVVVFAVTGVGDKGQAAAYAADADTVRSAEEAYCARHGSYATEEELVAKGFLQELSTNTDVALGTGNTCGTGANSSYSLSTSSSALNVAANADQWITSDTGSGPGYASSAFVYPLNSNLNDPLIIMNSDYTLSGGLAASWERIPQASDRATFTSAQTPVAKPLPAHAYPGDRPYPADTWRFHLRTGVKFHDGQDFDADDVIWTWRDRQALSGSMSSGANTLSYTMRLAGTAPAQYDSIEKIDDFTVDITPTTQNLRFPEQVLHPKGAIVQVLRDGSGNPLAASFGAAAGLSTPRTIGRHLDGSTAGLPAATTFHARRTGVGTTSGSNTVTGAGFDAGDVGKTAFGTGIPSSPATTITAVTPGVSATLSANATVTGTATVTLAVANASTGLVTGTPQGTGPFKFNSYSPTVPQGGGSASFLRNDDYWGSSKAQVQRMNYTFISDPAVRTAGLQSGQYDFVMDLNPLDVPAIEAAGRVVKAPYGQNALFYVNKVVKIAPGTLDLTRVPPLTPPNHVFNLGTDPAVRKAISLSIDRNAYIAAIFGGNASPGRWMSPPGILGTFQNDVPAMTTNVALASSTLDTAGWTCANGGPQGAPGAATPCAANEIRKWNGAASARSVDTTNGNATVTNASPAFSSADLGKSIVGAGIPAGAIIVAQTGATATLSRQATATAAGVGASVSKFFAGRPLDIYTVGISLVPQAAYDLIAAQTKLAGINMINQRGSCDSQQICPDGTVGRGQMYNSTLWDLDLELPNQNDANAAFLPVLRQACVNQVTTFRFAPADGTNGIGASVTDPGTLGGGVLPFGTTPCTSPGNVQGPMDATWVPQSQGATTPPVNQEAAANMMRILVGQNESNVVIPVVGQFRIYGMSSKVNLGDPHPSQTSQRWVSLTQLF